MKFLTGVVKFEQCINFSVVKIRIQAIKFVVWELSLSILRYMKMAEKDSLL